MLNEEMGKLTSEDLFNKWQNMVKDEGLSHYSADSRQNFYLILAEMFLEHKISLEEAKTYNNKAMKIFTTTEGRKGKGPHKGWSEQCAKDFDIIMADIYIPTPNGRRKDILGDGYYAHPDPDIVAWVNEVHNGNPEVMHDAHTIGHIYNLMFLVDTYG